MEYVIEKAPDEIVNKKKSKKINIPLENMKVGDMIKSSNTQIYKTKFYNAIKHKRNYTKECEGWQFTIKVIDKDTIACIRLK